MKVKRFKTIVSLAGVFNSDIEFVEYSTKKGTFYRKGYYRSDKAGLDFSIHDKIFKMRDIDKWFEPLPSIDIKDTEEFPQVNVELKRSIKVLDTEIDLQQKKLNSLLKQRRELSNIIYDF